jgi:hypothetical protein
MERNTKGMGRQLDEKSSRKGPSVRISAFFVELQYSWIKRAGKVVR